MQRTERIHRASDLYHQMASLERQLALLAQAPEVTAPKTLMVIRAQMAALEHQIALLRLIQSESRLRQQLWIAIPSLLGGSLATLLLQRLLGS